MKLTRAKHNCASRDGLTANHPFADLHVNPFKMRVEVTYADDVLILRRMCNWKTQIRLSIYLHVYICKRTSHLNIVIVIIFVFF